MMKRKRSTITKAKMLKGISNILIEEGCGKVNVASVSAYSGIDRKLLYYHFGNFSNMIAQFLQLDDVQFKEASVDPEDDQAIGNFVKQRMNTLLANPLLSQVLVWELSAKIPALQEYAKLRNQNDQNFIQRRSQSLDDSEVKIDLEAIFALLVGGVQYLSAYSHHNKKPFFGINFQNEQERQHVLDLFDRMLSDIEQTVEL
ncbi:MULTISPECIES: TetR/AcrR family transcriptional regulator [Sphingobacterium]|uniref:TetR/AcrR family transcriptional regulator n=1 Tax=Sphingobacterium populi TaxID=1812824 RepID=A0ABW5UB65_9SPHI|nr:TetR/AcrR family transcriptional regulator [Sphingobacterium sp. CFCC 11742]